MGTFKALRIDRTESGQTVGPVAFDEAGTGIPLRRIAKPLRCADRGVFVLGRYRQIAPVANNGHPFFFEPDNHRLVQRIKLCMVLGRANRSGMQHVRQHHAMDEITGTADQIFDAARSGEPPDNTE